MSLRTHRPGAAREGAPHLALCGPHAHGRRAALAAGVGWAVLGATAALGLHLPGRALAQAPAFSEEARRRMGPGASGAREEAERARTALLRQAEQHLAAGQAQAALDALDRAALMRHSADTELAGVRALMALGEYRRAMMAGAHVAGAHREQSAGVALYAWLLHVGGQEVVARRVLADALERLPGDALLEHTREQLGGEWPLAGDPLLQKPWCAAPVAFSDQPDGLAPEDARVLGTAVLLADGRHALAPRATLPAGAVAWVRNGLGQTLPVLDRRSGDHPDLDLLVLRGALPAPDWPAATREPYAGSPGNMVEYAPDARGRPAWPLLRQGFFAGVPGTLPSRPLGLGAPRGPRGGPVFDSAGRLAGLALGGAPGAEADRLVSLPRLRAAFGDGLPALTAAPGPTPRHGPDLAYEISLRGTLQLLAHGTAG